VREETTVTRDRYTEDLAAFVDGELPERRRLEVERHLETCPGCATVVAAADEMTRRLSGAVARYPTLPSAREILERASANACVARANRRAR
jgi:anti-sigma factor RsiW